MSESTIGDVLGTIGGHAPWSKAAGWDPVGLQLGDPDRPARRIAVCHEVTETVVAAVEADAVDLLISYHPLLFRPTTRLVAGRSPGGRAFRLVTAGAGLAVVHTSFDVATGGAADALAEVLGIEDTTGFGPVGAAESIKVVTFAPADSVDRIAEAMAEAGAGRIGNYSACSYRSEGTGTFRPDSWARPTTGAGDTLNQEPEVRLEMMASRSAESSVVAALVSTHPYEEPAYDVYDRRGNDGMLGRVGRPPGGTTLRSFAHMVAEVLGGSVRLSWAGADFNLAAVVPGSGAGLIEAAAAAGARVLVTGDIRHHEARRAIDLGLSIIDPGHARTERPGVAALLTLMQGTGLEVIDLTGIDPSPWEGVQ
ncbi:MAG: Nif3-like dinuclear metal center hexameric protein [Acidimicrobiia bacterium]|nr:Nif3-like dinuclear metal center hexameric protein [Acidimicrobiia bacterium]